MYNDKPKAKINIFQNIDNCNIFSFRFLENYVYRQYPIIYMLQSIFLYREKFFYVNWSKENDFDILEAVKGVTQPNIGKNIYFLVFGKLVNLQ